MKPSGFVDLIGLMGLRSKGRAVWFTAARLGRAQPFSGRDARAFQLLSPHVCRTIKISHALDLRTLKSESLEAALDELSAGVFLLDGGARVVHANRAGERQLKAGSALRVVNNRLSPTDHSAGEAFIGALSSRVEADEHLSARMHSIAMPATEGEGLIATILPLADGERSSLMSSWSAHWAVFTQEPIVAPNIPGEAFGGELRVVLAVAPGLGAMEAAELLGFSEPTVRTHLQRSFEKTGTTRQTELIRLLMASMPPIQGRPEPLLS
jgi:PAS domain-containing protein